jgi:hypothetical protein
VPAGFSPDSDPASLLHGWISGPRHKCECRHRSRCRELRRAARVMPRGTARLTLREVEPRDAALLIALRTDADVRRYLGGPMTLDAATAMADVNISDPSWLRDRALARR